MLVRFDPFRDFDRMASEFSRPARPWPMPMDAYRRGNAFMVHLDVPGVDPGSIDLTVEKNVLTVSAQRSWQPTEGDQVVASERPQGSFSRQLFLGEGLDTEHVEPTSHVLTLTNVFRDDVAGTPLPRDAVLAAAPDHEDGFFKVPPIIETE